MEIFTLVAAVAVGAFATWQAMTIQQLKAETKSLRARLDEQAAQLNRSQHDTWAEVQQRTALGLRNAVKLMALSTRDNMDALMQIAPDELRRIVRELGIGKEK